MLIHKRVTHNMSAWITCACSREQFNVKAIDVKPHYQHYAKQAAQQCPSHLSSSKRKPRWPTTVITPLPQQAQA